MIVRKLKYISIIFISLISISACNLAGSDESSEAAANVAPQVGDQVPNNLVCMVNDAYMGIPQLEVSYEGKIYYGCCEMCQERIPKEKEARIAVDPYTLKDVDKADAYIVLVGDQGQVAYFENERSYKELMAKSDLAKERNQRNQHP
ncbi:hypothetical protein [Albibacterium profundi]|uniref:TRASH transcription regulator C-terminal archaeal domain-containing protein n=1 Tax=Albibacterium profundi TaxID=3134906 RepID=A0ABV5CHG5_9SPHI